MFPIKAGPIIHYGSRLLIRLISFGQLVFRTYRVGTCIYIYGLYESWSKNMHLCIKLITLLRLGYYVLLLAKVNNSIYYVYYINSIRKMLNLMFTSLLFKATLFLTRRIVNNERCCWSYLSFFTQQIHS